MNSALADLHRGPKITALTDVDIVQVS